MTTPADAFPVAPLRFVLRSGGLRFPGFSGSYWHGGFGMILQRHFPDAFARLYGGHDQAPLYALQPAVTEDVPNGMVTELNLTLFGPATEHALACTQAIDRLGREGMDPAGRFELVAASVRAPTGDESFYTPANGLTRPPLAQSLNAYRSAAPAASAIRMTLHTPLRIKEGNDLLRAAPNYRQLVQRLLGRLDQIAHASGTAPQLAKATRVELLDEARQVALVASDLRWLSLDRRSARTRQKMHFGGLVGTLDYTGDMMHTLPWLWAGQNVQLGGKTAFGFGGYSLTAPA